MSILKVARMGHPVLRTKARPIAPNDLKHPALQNLIDDMLDTMAEYHGVGLAAPQIHESLRIFVGVLDVPKPDDKDAPDPEPIAIINPEITPIGSDTVEDWEGCLSIPDIRGRVPRAQEIRLRGFNREGGRIAMTPKDFPAGARVRRMGRGGAAGGGGGVVGHLRPLGTGQIHSSQSHRRSGSRVVRQRVR